MIRSIQSSVQVGGIKAGVRIARDGHGVPHVLAASAADAWFGLGFAAAQDRLWQMEYDRRRAAGRWAEAAGRRGLPGDLLARRLRLSDAAKADLTVLGEETRAALYNYARGINAYLESGLPLPPEYAATGITPEAWQPWHSVAAFKVRHVLMGLWQHKLAQALILVRAGAEAFRQLEVRPPLGSVVAVPPGGRLERLYAEAGRDLEAAAHELGFLAEVEAGSNAWAVHGSRTATGRPILCNDSHRALDVPNVYWQAHVCCPEFNVIGATFPGLPGFPHFGHNGAVAWAITHAGADYQDLYVERFDIEGDLGHLGPAGWLPSERCEETIAVRGEAAITVETWKTRHGPVVHGDPRSGYALSLRYTATERPCGGLDVLLPMLRSRDVEELLESQREWVDPVNNLVAADTAGNIGYLTRGRLPSRRGSGHQQLPVTGWTDEHEWTGFVPFAEMPRTVNPPAGFIVTSNQAISAADSPYISYSAAEPSRAERIVELVSARSDWTVEELAAIQGDVLSISGRWWGRRLAELGPWEGDAEAGRRALAGWDGAMLPTSGAALLYACFRRALGRRIFQPLLGAGLWEWVAEASLPPTAVLARRWLGNLEHGWRTRPDTVPEAALLEALAAGWRDAAAIGGPDHDSWRWADHHSTAAQHTVRPDWSPPAVGVGGDAETVQAAAYSWTESDRFDITNLSVYRQVVSLAELENATFVVPGGTSGVPGDEHYSDQLELWRDHERIPMRHTPAAVAAATVRELTLNPAAR